MTLSFSLAALTVRELAPPALIDVAAAWGYDHVGIRLLPAVPGGIAYPLMVDEASLREIIARLDATGITVADLEVVAFRPETEIAAFFGFFETAELAKTVDAKARARRALRSAAVLRRRPHPGPRDPGHPTFGRSFSFAKIEAQKNHRDLLQTRRLTVS